MKPELPDRVAAMAWCTPVQVTAPASITQRRRLTNVDLCSKQTEGEAAELADALKHMSRKVKLVCGSLRFPSGQAATHSRTFLLVSLYLLVTGQ